jgi:hypothetical protein
MQNWPYFKWEYLSVTLSPTGRQAEGQAQFLPRWINGQELENWQQSSHYIEFMNQLGELGWELTASSGNTLFFKRPKS